MAVLTVVTTCSVVGGTDFSELFAVSIVILMMEGANSHPLNFFLTTGI